MRTEAETENCFACAKSRVAINPKPAAKTGWDEQRNDDDGQNNETKQYTDRGSLLGSALPSLPLALGRQDTQMCQASPARAVGSTPRAVTRRRSKSRMARRREGARARAEQAGQAQKMTQPRPTIPAEGDCECFRILFAAVPRTKRKLLLMHSACWSLCGV